MKELIERFEKISLLMEDNFELAQGLLKSLTKMEIYRIFLYYDFKIELKMIQELDITYHNFIKYLQLVMLTVYVRCKIKSKDLLM
jgi:hypothetical protein